MNPDPKFQQAIAQEIVWKHPELQRFAVELMQRALKQGGHFTTDIVPDEVRGDGHGIAGSVIELLKNAGLIQPVGHTDPRGQWYALRTKSTRPDRKSAWLCVYQLTNPALAQSFLARHGKTFSPVQMELVQ
jgi:Tfp pilus assembly protein PilW